MTLLNTLMISAVMAAGLTFTEQNAMATETPNYSVTQEMGDKYERRAYPSMLLAEVTLTGTRGDAANAAFRILANFIFGDNEQDTKIAMTAPVVQVPVAPDVSGSANSWTVNFMMPSKFTLATLPKTQDSRIRIYESAPYEAISLRFSGRSTLRNLAKHKDKLDAKIRALGLSVDPTPIYAFYDAPYVPGFARRNEIMYRLMPQNAPEG